MLSLPVIAEIMSQVCYLRLSANMSCLDSTCTYFTFEMFSIFFNHI